MYATDRRRRQTSDTHHRLMMPLPALWRRRHNDSCTADFKNELQRSMEFNMPFPLKWCNIILRKLLNYNQCFIGINWGDFPQSVEFTPMIVQYCHKLIHLKTTSFDFPTVNLVSYTKISYSITKCTLIDSRLNGIRNFLLSTIQYYVTGEAILRGIVENLWAVGAPPWTPLVELSSIPRPPSLLLPPQQPHRSRPSTSIFGSSGLIWQSPPTIFIPPG